MLKHIWTVICKKSLIDQSSNNLSLLEVLEELQIETNAEKVDGKYSFSTDFEIINFWTKPEGKDINCKYRINFISPSGKELGKSIEKDITSVKDYKRIRTRLVVQGLSVDESGTYQFIVSLVDNNKVEKVASIPLDIKIDKVKS